MHRRRFLIQTGILGSGVLTGTPVRAENAGDSEGDSPRQEGEPGPAEVLETLWRGIQDNYPMLEFVGAHGDAWLEEFRPRVAAAKSLAEAFPILEELVCRLRDYHTRLWWPGKPDLASLPVCGHELTE